MVKAINHFRLAENEEIIYIGNTKTTETYEFDTKSLAILQFISKQENKIYDILKFAETLDINEELCKEFILFLQQENFIYCNEKL